MEPAQRSFVPKPIQEVLVHATPNVYVTQALVVINVAYLAITVLFGANPVIPDASLWSFGALFGPNVYDDGEWWRLGTAMFLHGGFIHLVFNMWALWILGDVAERMFGSLPFLLIYLACGLGGSVGTLLWHPHVTSSGASGAIFGLLGAIVTFVHFSRFEVSEDVTSHFKRLLVRALVLSLAFTLVIDLIFPVIDNAAHFGGLVVGLILGAAFRRPLPNGKRSLALLGIFPATLVAIGAFASWSRTLAAEDPYMRVAEAMKLYVEDQPAAAGEKLEEALRLDPDLWEAQLQVGMLAFENGDFERAVRGLSRAIELNEDAAPYRPMLGFAYSRIDELEKARAELDKALEDNPDEPFMLSEVGIVQHRLGDNDDAIASLRKAVELDDGNSEHHNRLALVLAVTGDADGSLAAIESALDIDPRAAHLWDSRGTVFFYRKEWPEAIRSYRRAIQLDPESAIYHYNLSLALEASGKPVGAAQERERAFELDPDLDPPPDGAPVIWS